MSRSRGDLSSLPEFWRQCADEQRQIAEDYHDETKAMLLRVADDYDWNAKQAENGWGLKRKTA